MERQDTSAIFFGKKRDAVKTTEHLFARLRRFQQDHDGQLPEDLRLTLNDILSQLDQISRDLNSVPQKLVVLGDMQIGKSSFINELLGCKLLRVGRGVGTTAVLTEVTRRDQVGFRGTVKFRSHDKIAEFVQYVLAEEESRKRMAEFKAHKQDAKDVDPERKTENSKLESIQIILKGIFGFIPKLDEDLKLLPVADKIGSDPIHFEAATLDKLQEMMYPYMVPEEGSSLTLMVESISFEGPFDCLPAGVTLIDTPGLGDVEAVNSERTFELLDTENLHLWYVMEALMALEKKDHKNFLERVLVTDGRNRNVSLVCTKVDRAAMDTEQTIDEFIQDRKAAMLRRLKNIRKDHSNADEIMIESIFFGYIHCTRREPYPAPARGFEVWQSALQKIGAEADERLRLCEDRLQSIKNRVINFGLTPAPANVPKDKLGHWAYECEAGIAQIGTQLSFFHDSRTAFYKNVCESGLWSRLWYTTLAATMDVWRRGVFTSRGQVRQAINFNMDVAVPCLTAAPAVGDVFSNHLLQWISNLKLILIAWAERPPGLMKDVQVDLEQLRTRFEDAHTQFFNVIALSNHIRDFLSDKNRCYG
jgi:hypothetical protein